MMAMLKDMVLFDGEFKFLFWVCLVGFCAGNLRMILKQTPNIRFVHGLVLGVLNCYGGSTLAAIICGQPVPFVVNEKLIVGFSLTWVVAYSLPAVFMSVVKGTSSCAILISVTYEILRCHVMINCHRMASGVLKAGEKAPSVKDHEVQHECGALKCMSLYHRARADEQSRWVHRHAIGDAPVNYFKSLTPQYGEYSDEERKTLLDDAKARVQREACAAVLRAFGVTRSNGGDGAAPPMEPPAADGLAKGGTASRATVVLPSGAGKTVCALRVAEALRSQLTLVLVPSIELVSQTYREWERWREQGALDGWRPLAVVSSSSEPTLPRTTKVDEIVSYLRASQGRPQVIFCTYHSARRVAEALDGDGACKGLAAELKPPQRCGAQRREDER